MDLKLIYNPFLVQTEVFLKGTEQIKKGNKLECFLESRIQDWDYDDLVQKLFQEFNEEEINLTFKGREMDYEDFQLGFETAQNPNNIKFKFAFEQGSKNTDIINKLKVLFQKIEEGPFEELKTEEIKRIFERFLNSEFPISVLATMSSGKSTLINALLEQKLLPSKQQACTAKVTKIKDVDGLDYFSATSYDQDHNIIDKKENITDKDLESFNESADVHEIEIIGDVPNIASDSMNLVIYDTPGPNNSQNEDHGRHAFRMISSDEKPLILYVLNATQFGINDDKNLLVKIAEQMNQPGKQSKDRFLFVVNKIDQFDLEEDGEIDILIERGGKYLEDIGIIKPKIIPISAEYAKVIRLYQNGLELTRNQKKTLKDHDVFLDYFELEKYADVSESVKRQIIEKIETAEDSYTQALLHTGVPSLEHTINEYLTKYALPIKVKKSIESITRFLVQKDIEKNLKDMILHDEKKRKELQEKAKKIKEIIQNGEKSYEMKKRIENLKPNYDIVDQKKLEIIEKIQDINNRFLSKTETDEGKKGLIQERKADFLLSDLKITTKTLENEVFVKSEEIINSEVKDKAHKYSEEFKEYVSGLLENIDFTEDQISSDFTNFIKAEFPSESEIQDMCETRSEKTGQKRKVKNEDKKWYKFWTWADPKYNYEDIYEDVKYVNIEKILESTLRPLTINVRENFENLKKQLSENISEIKEIFVLEIARLEGKLEEKMEEIEKISQSKKSVEENINKNKEKTAWLKDITSEFDKIFS